MHKHAKTAFDGLVGPSELEFGEETNEWGKAETTVKVWSKDHSKHLLPYVGRSHETNATDISRRNAKSIVSKLNSSQKEGRLNIIYTLKKGLVVDW
jgi:hypothetical protein